jgi:hypothetical protein
VVGHGRASAGVGFAVCAAAALAVLLLANPFGLEVIPSRPQFVRDDPGLLGATMPIVGPELFVEVPPSDLQGTTTSTVEAVWGGSPAGCILVPGWFSWFLPPGAPARGTLQDPGAALAAFVPATVTSGPSEVGVRSASEISCGTSNWSVTRTAYGNVTTYPPLSLTDLSVGPSGTAVPGPVNLSGDLEGGRPPYHMVVGWGDGASTTLAPTAPGPFRLPHTFPLGTFRPGVTVSDAYGQATDAAVPEPVEASNGTVLAIRASLPLAEVGFPVDFTGTVLRASSPLGVALGCSPSVEVPPRANLTKVTCHPSTAGFLSVTFKYATLSAASSQEKTLDEPVAAPVAIVVQPALPAADVGVPTFVRVTVSGGVPPFNVSCSSAAGPFASLSSVPTDGSFLVPWTPPAAGPSALTGSVRDSLGGAAAGPWSEVWVQPPLNLSLHANATMSANLTTVGVAGTVTGGSNGSLWAVTADPVPVQGGFPSGTVVGGRFDWAASYVQEGVAGLDVTLLDLAGDFVHGTVTTALPLPPTVNVSTLSPSGGPLPALRILLDVAGGIPPFSVWVNSSWGDRWNGSDPTPGSWAVDVPLGHAGEANLALTLVDARGDRTNAHIAAHVSEAPRGASGPSAALWLPLAGVVLVGVIGGTLAAVRWRRRDPQADLPPLDPEAVLERLIAPADGADRLTIELMAEEAGVPLATAHATVDRLVADGRIRSESDPDGGEVLAWSNQRDE